MKRSKQPTFDPITAELPQALATAEFKAAWAEWAQHRRELGKPLTATATRQQLAKLAALGPQRAVAAISHSIAQGWQGVYEPDQPRNQTNGRRDLLDEAEDFYRRHKHKEDQHNGHPRSDDHAVNGVVRCLEPPAGPRSV